MRSSTVSIARTRILDLLGPGLLARLTEIYRVLPDELYLAGGTVRDLLLGRAPADIDLTVDHRARRWARRLAGLTGGAFVVLGREEDAARVVWQGKGVDFSSFREGAATIGEELLKRDITVNAMAVRIDPLLAGGRERRPDALQVIDPAGGIRDLDRRLIRVTSRWSFTADPLRLLRVFRFAAVLDFAIDPQTLELARRKRELISRVAAERISHELDLIMASERAHLAFAAMAETGLLWEIVPELEAGVGMEQPASHHLDVFAHCLEALGRMEEIQQDPARFFPEHGPLFNAYLARDRRRVRLKWAALLHDAGKPVTYAINEDKGGRITFYNHDLKGADILADLAARLRWSRDDTSTIASLVAAHMRPFFLANVLRRGELTLKACLRLINTMGDELPGLFLLAMADALAGRGEGRPDAMEEELAALFARLEEVRRRNVVPVRSAPPLITGRDLIEELGLEPGPIFRDILSRVEEAQMERTITTRGQALALAAACARQAGENH
ncbi:MAG TPA: HD domain-containing protein [Desulfobulbus sp.]|nr:HD domain-containing protein [Desulfobulbus sp.]